MSSRLRVVVAKYNEPHHWIDECRAKGVPFVIYDKSDQPMEGSIRVPNEGREAETLLRYIIENYDDLPDATVFLQGDPRGTPMFCPSYEGVVQTIVDIWEKLQAGQPAEYKPVLTHQCPADLDHVWARKAPTLNEALFGTRSNGFWFGGGAQYMLPKENILCRPKRLYEIIRQRLLEFGWRSFDAFYQGLDVGIDAWTLEIMWGAIFDPVNKLIDNYEDNLKPNA